MAMSAQSTVRVTASPACDTSIYASGDLIGGKLTFSNALSAATGSGVILGATICDLAKQDVALELVIFGTNPSNTTFTDQAAFDPDDADLPAIQGVIYFNSSSGTPSNSFLYNDNSVHHVNSIEIPVRGYTSSSNTAISRHLYGALVSRGTPTFSAIGDVTITLLVGQD